MKSYFQPNFECKNLKFIKQNLGDKVLVQKEKSPTLQLKAVMISKFNTEVIFTG